MNTFTETKKILDEWTMEEKHKFIREYILITEENIKYLHKLFNITNLDNIKIDLTYKK